MKKPNLEKNPNLAEELLIEIFSRLPAKSVGRCRCLSKSWGQYLSTSQFVKLHHTRGSTSHLIQFTSNLHTFNLDEDNTVVLRKLAIPAARFTEIAGYCNGFVLLLLLGRDNEFFVVNPATLEQVTITSRPAYHITSHGFGYDSGSDDYKIVRLSLGYPNSDLMELETFADVYSLKKGAWNRIIINPRLLAPAFPALEYYGVFVNGAIYWLACLVCPSDSVFPNVIVAFDVASESLSYIGIPNLNCRSTIFANGECLLMLCNGDIWMMKEHGEENSWTKFLTSVTFEDWREVTPLFLVGGNEVVLARHRSLSMWDLIHGTTKDLIVNGALGRVNGAVTYVESLDSPIQYCSLN